MKEYNLQIVPLNNPREQTCLSHSLSFSSMEQSFHGLQEELRGDPVDTQIRRGARAATFAATGDRRGCIVERYIFLRAPLLPCKPNKEPRTSAAPTHDGDLAVIFPDRKADRNEALSRFTAATPAR